MQPSQAIYQKMFSYMGLRDGWWPWIGVIPGWDESLWPLPSFYSKFPDLPKFGVEAYYEEHFYDPTNLDREIETRRFPLPVPDGIPKDGLAGYKFMELKLNDLIYRDSGNK
ncbi:MAG: hypothetical protein ACRDAX_04375 [Propionibacteriaceae bacterium]